jgi:hypothetical protein
VGIIIERYKCFDSLSSARTAPALERNIIADGTGTDDDNLRHAMV